jgi:uncharacterized protein YndB with AHSA1/START domain
VPFCLAVRTKTKARSATLMWFQVSPAEISYTQSSPFQIQNETVIHAPPDRVFEILTDGTKQHEWFKDFVACRWTSAPPYGVGSTREIELKTLTVKERFLAWDPGKRLSFCIYAITQPLVSEMVEDLQLEPASNGSTRLRWTAHYTPTLLMRAVHPIARMKFGAMFKASLEELRRYAERK